MGNLPSPTSLHSSDLELTKLDLQHAEQRASEASRREEKRIEEVTELQVREFIV
jgi:hypothetical protein